MFKIVALLFVVLAICHADTYKCGEMPNQLYRCLGNPTIIAKDVIKACLKYTNPCDRNRCMFEEYGWLDGTSVNKPKVAQWYDDLAKRLPEWTQAVQQTKTACLTSDLPALGSYLNCPSYDIMLCSISTFFKNAQPTQWLEEPECEEARQYVQNCPVCPHDCFAPSVPEGSCQACKV